MKMETEQTGLQKTVSQTKVNLCGNYSEKHQGYGMMVTSLISGSAIDSAGWGTERHQWGGWV